MKCLFAGFCLLLLVSCVNNTGKPVNSDGPGKNDVVIEVYRDTAWFADFRALSAALVRGDRAAVKQWFNFPIIDSINDIWTATDTGGYVARGDTALPFTEKDFDLRFERLFPPELIKGLGKVRLDSIVPGMADDVEISRNDSMRYSLLTYVDGAKTEFNLVLNSVYYPVVDGKREEEQGAEGSLGYIFDIKQGRKLVFREVRIAE